MWPTCPKTWNGGKKQAFFVAQIGGGQKWAPYLFRLKSIFYKNAKKQNLLPFLNSYYYQNCCRADSFQHLYINNARKWYKVLIIRGMREKWIRKSASNPQFCFLPGITAVLAEDKKKFLKMRISLNFFCVTIFFVYLCKIN